MDINKIVNDFEYAVMRDGRSKTQVLQEIKMAYNTFVNLKVNKKKPRLDTIGKMVRFIEKERLNKSVDALESIQI